MPTSFTPLFTGGSGRSGTTIIVNLLKSHPEIHSSLPREIKYITSRYGLVDLNFGRPIKLEEDLKGVRNNLAARINNRIGKSKEELFLTFLKSKWWKEVGKKGNLRGLVQGVTEEQLTEISSRFSSSYKKDLLVASRQFFYDLSSCQFKKDTVRYFADSTPVNTMQAHFIYQLFPNALFINMIRDGRDVAYSVSKESWGPSDPLKGLKWWGNRVLVSHQSLSQLPNKQHLEIRLEELIVSDRESQYLKILNFLGISDHPSVREFFNLEMRPEKMSQGEWKEKVKDPIAFDREYDKVLLKLKQQGINIKKLY
ncbi:MAG: sulfotransferase family protein [Candidatus Nanopelagicaceae bacterium]